MIGENRTPSRAVPLGSEIDKFLLDYLATLKGLDLAARSPALPRAGKSLFIEGKVEEMNVSDRGGKCTECGSNRIMVGLSHYECEGCGRLLESLPPQHGFVPDSARPRELRKSTDRNSLGSGIDGSDGSHRLRDTHARTSHKKPLFLDIAIGEIVNECGTNKISADAANLLIEVDKENNLGRIRRRMRGCEGMGREESREYRARAFAAAALHIRNSEGQSNTAPQVARDWGLRYSDLALAIKIINRFRRSRNAPPREPPASRRSRELRQEVERIRDYLSEQLEMESVIEVVDQTILRLRRAGEPFHPGDEWLTGHLCNDPPTRAAFECAIRSIADIGLPLSCARTLYIRLPISGMSYFMERTCPSLFE